MMSSQILPPQEKSVLATKNSKGKIMKYVVKKHETKTLKKAIACYKSKRPFLAGGRLAIIDSYQVRPDGLVLTLSEFNL